MKDPVRKVLFVISLVVLIGSISLLALFSLEPMQKTGMILTASASFLAGLSFYLSLKKKQA